jgi:glutamate-1-semialdehyde aminotransferase
VSDGTSFARVDQDLWARFVKGVRENGVLLPSRSAVTSFISHAHGVKDIEKVLAAFEITLRRMQKEDEA